MKMELSQFKYCYNIKLMTEQKTKEPLLKRLRNHKIFLVMATLIFLLLCLSVRLLLLDLRMQEEIQKFEDQFGYAYDVRYEMNPELHRKLLAELSPIELDIWHTWVATETISNLISWDLIFIGLFFIVFYFRYHQTFMDWIGKLRGKQYEEPYATSKRLKSNQKL